MPMAIIFTRYHKASTMFTTELFLVLSFTSFLGISAAPGIASDPPLAVKMRRIGQNGG